jgi:ABC-type polysaccharide/polyol phosphate export permease
MTHHVRAIWQFRYFWLSLVRLDLRNRYRRSVLGIGWSLLNPLAMTVVFCVVFGGIIGQGDWTWFAPYLLAGLAVWEFIRSSAIQGCDSFIRAESYIRQCPLPYAIYPLRTVLGTFIHFAISMAVVVVATAVVLRSTTPLLMVGAVLPGVLLVTVFAWGVATLSAFGHVYFHDTKHLFEAGSQMYFFLTPIMYTRKVLEDRQLGWVADLNPVTVYLDIIRDPLLTGVPPSAEQFAVAGGLALAAFGLACGAIAWLQKKVIFQL